MGNGSEESKLPTGNKKTSRKGQNSSSPEREWEVSLEADIQPNIYGEWKISAYSQTKSDCESLFLASPFLKTH